MEATRGGKNGVTTKNSSGVSRRQFLRASIGAGLAGLALTLGGRRLLVAPGDAAQRAAAGGVREIGLEARELDWELAPGKMVKGMAYNGSIPGPEIRVREGERLRVTLRNALREPTTIHWHGVDVPNAMDGVPGVTQEPVAAGQTFVYEFVARPAGTRWYHTHFSEHRQLDLGLYAPLIIEPARPEPFRFDREHTLVLDDWATGSTSAIAGTTEGKTGRRGGKGGMLGGRGGGQERPYDTMTVNGKAWPATEPLRLRKGEQVRLRLINASADHTHVIRLAGHRLQVTHTDGNPLVEPVAVDAVPIAPSERYDLLVSADRPGAWILTCLQPGHADAGEKVLVVYEGHERAESAAPDDRVADRSLWHYGLGRGRDTLRVPSGQERRHVLTLSGGMGSDLWLVNGRKYPHTDPLRLRRGDLARVRFINQSKEAHPMHLHGQSFKVVAIKGRRFAAPIVKDSVDVEPHTGSVDAEFTAHNPGDWFLHCHKPMHMEGGMIVLAKVAET